MHRALGVQRDSVPGSNATGLKRLAHGVDGRVKLRVRPGLTARLDGDRFWLTRGLLRQNLIEKRRRKRLIRPSLPPFLRELMELCPRYRRQLRKRRRRIRGDVVHPRLEAFEPSLDRFPRQNIGVVAGVDRELAVRDQHIKRQVERRLRLRHVAARHSQITKRRKVLLGVQVQDRLHQRHAASGPAHVQQIQQRPERHLSVFAGIEHPRLYGFRPVGKRRLRVDLHAHRQHVYAMPNQRLAPVQSVLQSGRDTDNEVVLSGNPGEKRPVPREKRREERRPHRLRSRRERRGIGG